VTTVPGVGAGVAGVMARIATIEARFVAPSRPSSRSAQAAGAAAGGDASGFAGVLESLTNGSGDGEIGQKAVDIASRYLGTPYVYGGESPEEGGFDCSGLVQYVYRQLGVELPRGSIAQAAATTPIERSELRPGDLVFSRGDGNKVNGHVGIYAGNGRYIVAPKTGDVVRLRPLPDPGHITALRRVTGAAPSSASFAASGAGTAVGGFTSSARVKGAGGPFPAELLTGPARGTPFDDLFNAAGSRHGIPPRLLAALAQEESGFNTRAVSSAGAQGLMQFMPATAAGLGVNPLDPASAVDGAARLLSGHLARFGTLELAVAAYGAGGGAVARYGGVPPYSETRNAIAKVARILRETR